MGSPDISYELAKTIPEPPAEHTSANESQLDTQEDHAAPKLLAEDLSIEMALSPRRSKRKGKLTAQENPAPEAPDISYHLAKDAAPESPPRSSS